MGMIDKRTSISAFILAGGKSSRMGSDKGLLHWHGNTFAERIYHELKKCFVDVQIIANHEAYRSLPIPVCADLLPDCGPLGGIYTACVRAKTPFVFIVACDMPLVTEDSVYYFLSQCRNTPMNIAVVEEQQHPLFALYDTSLQTDLLAALQNEEYKLLDFIQQKNYYCVEMLRFADNLRNINTPLDFENLSKE